MTKILSLLSVGAFCLYTVYKNVEIQKSRNKIAAFVKIYFF